MFCPHCGNELPDDAGFCGNCGQKLTVKPEKAKGQPVSGTLFAKIGFLVLIAAIYAGITAVFFLLKPMEAGIEVESLYHGEAVSAMTFGSFLELLISGNRIFHPTVVSAALGTGLQVLYWIVPLFGILALIGAILDKKAMRFCVGASIVIGLTALLTALAVPLATWLIPGLRQAIALQTGVLYTDLGSVIFTQPIIMSVVALVLLAGVIIVTAVFLKWRAKK